MNAKLTAYALNELPPDERAAVEAEMETNPALRAEAEEMRKFCAMLHDEVSDADKTTLTSEQRFRVLREFSADTQPQPKKSERSIWRHPAFWVPTAIAACTTAMLVINLKEQHAPTAMEHEALVASTKGKNSTEDVRVNFEKAKPVAMSQTPAPGKPETPPLVASNSLTVRGGNMEGLPPMPTPSTPTSTIRLQPTGTPEAQPALELRAGSLVADLGTDFSSASENGRIAGTLEQANRGVQIGASRPPEHFRFSYDQMNETPANPVPAPMDLNGSLTAVDRTPTAPGNAGDLFFSQTVGGVPMAPSSPSYAWTDVNEPAVTLPDGTITLSDSNTYTGGVTLSSGGLVKGTGNANGTIHANGGGVIATGGMTVTAGNSVTLPSETANVSGVQSFGRNVSGTGAVAKTGAGTLTITNGSSYTGSSYISAGELVTEFSDTAGASGPPANMTLAGAPASPGAAPATSQPTSSLSASTGLAADGPRAKMLNEVNSDWETPVAPAMAATGSTAATPTSGKAGWRMDSGPPTDPNAQHDVSAPILAATPNAKRLSSASSMTPAGQPMDALSLADASTADAAMKTASGGALGAPGASTATPARPASTTPGMPAGVQPLAPGTSTGVFGAGVLPADPMTASAATPLPALNNPAPADKTRLYGITDGDSDAYRRSTATTTTRTTETLVREKKKEQEVEKLEKDLKQLGDIQEAEVRARKLVARHANGETYTPIYENPFLQVAQQPLSTFSIDVDTASYANVRRFLNNGQRPPADAVRLEELINYFPYSYESPAEDGAPFSVTVDMAEAPWQPMHRLARIALKGREIRKERGAANFVFLVDVSGSMDQPDKLPLVKQSLRMLTEQLKDTDRVAIVTYAGDTGVALTSTPGSERQKIQSAIEALTPGGSTNGAGGIRAAYQQASQNFIQEGVNRVILCTDGDFNVGISSPEELEKLIAEKAKSRVFLSVLGYGTGNLKDRTMETLADKGNGNYAYIDSLSEARKVLVDQINATLVTIAKDVKIQVEFNPAQVASYRLLGYENRALAKEDFNNDRKDAGEIGAGHTVTALYEIVPVGARAPSPDGRPAVDDLKYAPKPAESVVSKPPGPVTATPSRETMTVKLRYKQPTGDKSDLIEVPVTDKEQTMANAPRDFVFAASVTGFGMMLRNSQYAGELTWDMVRDMALRGKGEDPLGYRGEFLQLIDKARGLTEGRE